MSTPGGVTIWIVAFILLLSARTAAPATPQEPANVAADRAALLQGVASFDAVGVPSVFGLYESQAFAVVAAGSPGNLSVPVAASAIGSGRVVALGQYYLDGNDAPPANVAQFLRNAIRWLNPGRSPNVGVLSGLNPDGAVTFLTQQGFRAARVNAPITAGLLSSVNTLALDGRVLASSAEADLVREFVRNGGGLLVWANGWAWPIYTAPGKSLKTDFLGNRLLIEAGIAWTEGYVTGGYVVSSFPVSLNSLLALDYVTGGGADPVEQSQARNSVLLAVRYLPASSNPLIAKLNALKSTISGTVPSPSQPFSPAQSPAQTLAFGYLASEPVELVTAHPSSAMFPGAVPAGAPRVSRQVALNNVGNDRSRWQSTGLYAAPGEPVRISMSADAAKSGLIAVIGAHTDDLNYSEATTWTRAPIVSRSFDLVSVSNTVASAFGGLVYIRNVAAPVTLSFDGVVEAPRFRGGVTTLADWRSTLRNLPAPWAELESNGVIATVQSATIRNLDDPESLLATWDKALKLQERLAGWNPGENLPQRIAFDQQISAGYMHSGYPVMAWLNSQSAFLAFNAQYAPNEDTWGFLHEFGHNHQSPDWTFNGVGEVTNNLFAMYALEGIYGRPKEEAGRLQMPNYVKRRMGSYFSQPPNFARLTADPFDALIPYLQLVNGFGWDTFIDLFKEYRALASDQRPVTDAQKLDQFVTRLSARTGRNLGPFFQIWGFPVSSSAVASVAGLRAWLPEPDFPGAYMSFADPNVEINGCITLDRANPGPNTGIYDCVVVNSTSVLSVHAAVFRDGQHCGYANVVNGLIRCVVPKGWSGTISFKRGGYRFTPSQLTVGPASTDAFIGKVVASLSQGPTATLRGRVVRNGAGVSDVFPIAPGADCRATDSNGDYSCTIDPGWSGELSMTKGGATFAPTARILSNVTTSLGGLDFTASLSSDLPAADTQKPTVPAGLSAVAAGATQIDLFWTAATDNVGVTAYKVYRGGSLIATLGTVTGYSNTGLTPSTTYTYTVSACDAAGNCSAQSGAVSVTTPILSCSTCASATYVQKAYVAYYGRPADPAGQNYWATRMDQEGGSLASIIGAFGASAEFNRRYGGMTTTALVTKIYQQTLGRDPDPAGLAYYVGELQAGRRTLQSITLDVLNGATTPPDSTVVANKLDVAEYYTAKVAAGCVYGTDQDGVNILSGVSAVAATVTAAKAAINSRCGP